MSEAIKPRSFIMWSVLALSAQTLLASWNEDSSIFFYSL